MKIHIYFIYNSKNYFKEYRIKNKDKIKQYRKDFNNRVCLDPRNKGKTVSYKALEVWAQRNPKRTNGMSGSEFARLYLIGDEKCSTN